jgi:hypothetical protein
MFQIFLPNKKLNGYWKAGIFPVNDYLPYKNPVFIDRIGTHCAVGYLMQQSGAENLAQQINSEQQFAYVHEIKVAGVKEWADENGFTIDELAWIQPGYPPTIDAEDMDRGLNGTVNAIVIDPNTQEVYAGGSFSQSTIGNNCSNIAVWISGFAGYDWISVGSGVNGTVYALMLHDNKLYVGGDFTMAGSVSTPHVAVYDIALGQWQAMGNLDSTVRAFAVYNNEIYAGGDFTGQVSKWDGNAWQNINTGLIGNGSVRALKVWNNELVIGGQFDVVTGAPRKNVVSYDGVYMNIMGMGTPTPVNDFEIYKNQLYAGCDFYEGSDTCVLAKFDAVNDNWTIELKNGDGIYLNNLSQPGSIRDLMYRDTVLYAAGDFFADAMMTYGYGLTSITQYYSSLDSSYHYAFGPLLATDAPLNCIAADNYNIYFGGEFTTNLNFDTLNHIGYLQLLSVGINNKKETNPRVSVFPNPASANLVIKSISEAEKIVRYEVYDVSGKLMMKEIVNDSQKDISLQSLAAGNYTLKILTNDSSEIAQIVKQ